MTSYPLPNLYGLYAKILLDPKKYDSLLKTLSTTPAWKLRDNVYFDACIASYTYKINDWIEEADEYFNVCFGFYGYEHILTVIEQLNELIDPVKVNVIYHSKCFHVREKDTSGWGYERDHVSDAESVEKLLLEENKGSLYTILTATMVSLEFPESYTYEARAMIGLILSVLLRNTGSDEKWFNNPFKEKYDSVNCLQDLLDRSSGREGGHVSCEFKLTTELIKLLGNNVLMNDVAEGFLDSRHRQTDVWLTIHSVGFPNKSLPKLNYSKGWK